MSNPYSLTGRVALVTGASQGIGRACALALAAAGASVALAARNEAKLAEVAVEIAAAGNLTGAFLLSQAAISPMLKARWGRILNITSVVGQTGQSGQANYAASKAGLIGLTKSLARELAGRAITVNAVAPGYIETAMTGVLTDEQRTAMINQIPMARPGADTDIAHAVAFLASEAAGYITGHTLDINGGLYMG